MKYNNRFSLVLILSLLLLMAAGCGSSSTHSSNDQKQVSYEPSTLHVYAGAGLRQPLDEIGTAFQEKYNCTVEYTYGGSAQNCNQILLLKKGDVFVPGAEEELEPLRKAEMISREKRVIYHIPVIAVSVNSPIKISSVADLAKPGVKVGLGDPSANPIGKVAEKILEKNNIAKDVEKNVTVRTPTVNELIAYLGLEQIHASIVWEENTVNAKDKINVIHIPDEQNLIKTIPLAELTCSVKPEMSKQFCDFCAGEGMEIFKKHGYKPYEGN
ncbi:MAG: molybdate ABC transporter substrate-binding protein [Desulfitobacteriaceae bacterium]|nr:molybdate ABC transporter substrate-binding protein [Desulfitobacteriaceae bacterium]